MYGWERAISINVSFSLLQAQHHCNMNYDLFGHGASFSECILSRLPLQECPQCRGMWTELLARNTPVASAATDLPKPEIFKQLWTFFFLGVTISKVFFPIWQQMWRNPTSFPTFVTHPHTLMLTHIFLYSHTYIYAHSLARLCKSLVLELNYICVCNILQINYVIN